MNQSTEILNDVVITTKFVFNDKSPILYVYHYEDGMWQFSGDEEVFEDEDYLVVSLEEILHLDPSIKELPDLLTGYYAHRKENNNSWTIELIEED